MRALYDRFVGGLIGRAYSFRTPIREAQARLAWDDAQAFIYENLSRETRLIDSNAELRKAAFSMAPGRGMVMEFGVYRGASIQFFRDLMQKNQDERIIFGFDSFRGFSEIWGGLDKKSAKNTFDQGGHLPELGQGIRLIDGYIEDTLDPFLKERPDEQIAFIHIDTDTYSPALSILRLCRDRLSPGAIVLFDQLCGYTNWRNHEFRALSEALPRDAFEFLLFGGCGRRGNLIRAAIRII